MKQLAEFFDNWHHHPVYLQIITVWVIAALVSASIASFLALLGWAFGMLGVAGGLVFLAVGTISTAIFVDDL